jgi:putative FmdB family regulatory protein
VAADKCLDYTQNGSAPVDAKGLPFSCFLCIFFYRNYFPFKEINVPTYEYRCVSCGYQFEAVQRISDKPLSECPECKKPVERLISAGLSVIFKGSGFYSTDNKKASASEAPAKTPQKKDTTKEPSKTPA